MDDGRYDDCHDHLIMLMKNAGRRTVMTMMVLIVIVMIVMGNSSRSWPTSGFKNHVAGPRIISWMNMMVVESAEIHPVNRRQVLFAAVTRCS